MTASVHTRNSALRRRLLLAGSAAAALPLVTGRALAADPESQSGARILQDGSKLSSYRRFYLAATPYAQQRSDVLAVVYAELQRAGEWIENNPWPAAEWHAPLIGLDAATVAAANLRRSYRVQPVDAEALAEQQRIADAFTQAQILPRRISVADAPVWRPA